MTTVLPFFRSAASTIGDWSQQELAEFYRVEAGLVQAGLPVASERGVTDEGDPWFVFVHADGNVIVHFARVDGLYVIASDAFEAPVSGVNFRLLLGSIVERHPTLMLISRAPATRGNVVLHPAALLAALVATLVFHLVPGDHAAAATYTDAAGSHQLPPDNIHQDGSAAGDHSGFVSSDPPAAADDEVRKARLAVIETAMILAVSPLAVEAETSNTVASILNEDYPHIAHHTGPEASDIDTVRVHVSSAYAIGTSGADVMDNAGGLAPQLSAPIAPALVTGTTLPAAIAAGAVGHPANTTMGDLAGGRVIGDHTIAAILEATFGSNAGTSIFDGVHGASLVATTSLTAAANASGPSATPASEPATAASAHISDAASHAAVGAAAGSPAETAAAATNSTIHSGLDGSVTVAPATVSPTVPSDPWLTSWTKQIGSSASGDLLSAFLAHVDAFAAVPIATPALLGAVTGALGDEIQPTLTTDALSAGFSATAPVSDTKAAAPIYTAEIATTNPTASTAPVATNVSDTHNDLAAPTPVAALVPVTPIPPAAPTAPAAPTSPTTTAPAPIPLFDSAALATVNEFVKITPNIQLIVTDTSYVMVDGDRSHYTNADFTMRTWHTTNNVEISIIGLASDTHLHAAQPGA